MTIHCLYSCIIELGSFLKDKNHSNTFKMFVISSHMMPIKDIKQS
jgi:hypothetical protein